MIPEAVCEADSPFQTLSPPEAQVDAGCAEASFRCRLWLWSRASFSLPLNWAWAQWAANSGSIAGLTVAIADRGDNPTLQVSHSEITTSSA